MSSQNPYYDPDWQERLTRSHERVGNAGQARTDFEMAAKAGSEAIKEALDDEWLAALQERTEARIASFETIQDYTRWCLGEYCSGVQISDGLIERLQTIEDADRLVRNLIDQKIDMLKASPPTLSQ